jgi:hypothetical protein
MPAWKPSRLSSYGDYRAMHGPLGGRLGHDVHRRSVAIDVLTVGIAAVMLQDQEGGLKPMSYWARKLNPIGRDNNTV